MKAKYAYLSDLFEIVNYLRFLQWFLSDDNFFGRAPFSQALKSLYWEFHDNLLIQSTEHSNGSIGQGTCTLVPL